jgi:hypothetical protein
MPSGGRGSFAVNNSAHSLLTALLLIPATSKFSLRIRSMSCVEWLTVSTTGELSARSLVF